jgi:hypothetical protein
MREKVHPDLVHFDTSSRERVGRLLSQQRYVHRLQFLIVSFSIRFSNFFQEEKFRAIEGLHPVCLVCDTVVCIDAHPHLHVWEKFRWEKCIFNPLPLFAVCDL